MKKTTDFYKMQNMHRCDYSMLMSPKHLKRQNVGHGCTSNDIKKTANQQLLSYYDGQLCQQCQ